MLNQHPKKHRRAGPPNVIRDPLVDPGNPSYRYQARSTAHFDRPRSRMVALAASPPGPCSPRSPQPENATVMLVSDPFRHDQSSIRRGSPSSREIGRRLIRMTNWSYPRKRAVLAVTVFAVIRRDILKAARIDNVDVRQCEHRESTVCDLFLRGMLVPVAVANRLPSRAVEVDLEFQL